MKVLEQIEECRNKDLETALKTQQSLDMQDLSINKTDVISTRVCQTLGCGRKAFKQVTISNDNELVSPDANTQSK